MTSRNPQMFQRRYFLRTTGGLVAGALGAVLVRADDLPENTNPTAILGDSVEPNWHDRLEITVGNKGADLVGATERVIQAGVDYIARRGGGTVRILPGTYRMRNSVFLQSKVRLLGSGTDSVLVKEPESKTKLTIDGDHWDQEVTLADPKGFHVGDGVRLFGNDPFRKSANISQRTLVASMGNRFKLDSRLQERFYLGGESELATHFSLLQCTEIADVIIENLTLDGNKAHNIYDHGAYDDGCIRFDRSNRITVRGVTVHDFYCDGIVWGITHDVLVENCHLHDGARYAIHPGSGSQRTILRGNRLHHNDQGIYFCWGASHGLYEKNVIEDCGYGMTIGYRDSNNLIRDNDIRRSGVAGIRFRAASSEGNRIERNRIVDSGPEKGIAIDVNCSKSVTLMKNELRETRKPASRTGIRIAADCRDTRCIDNQIEGFATAIADLRKA